MLEWRDGSDTVHCLKFYDIWNVKSAIVTYALVETVDRYRKIVKAKNNLI